MDVTAILAILQRLTLTQDIGNATQRDWAKLSLSMKLLAHQAPPSFVSQPLGQQDTSSYLMERAALLRRTPMLME
jgi:hypothetical protein